MNTVQEVILWMEHILGDKLPSTDLHESLKSGIVLRELVSIICQCSSILLYSRVRDLMRMTGLRSWRSFFQTRRAACRPSAASTRRAWRRGKSARTSPSSSNSAKRTSTTVCTITNHPTLSLTHVISLCCLRLGMNDLSLFCTDDLYDGNNMVQVPKPPGISHAKDIAKPLTHSRVSISVGR